jgi:hypothetical protein
VGTAVQLDAAPDAREPVVGWLWEVARDGDARRQVRVEVDLASTARVTDLPAVAQHAVRSRGATAVDLFLAADEPPARLVVSKLGIRAHE